MIVMISESEREHNRARFLEGFGNNLDFCASSNCLQKSSIKQNISSKGAMKPLILFAINKILWLSTKISRAFKNFLESYVELTLWIDSAAALIVAWVVVRFVSGFIEHSLWARFIAILIWSIVALKILGLLESTTQLLSEYSFEFGYFKISLLTTFQAIIAFTFLFWAVNFLSDVIERRFNRSRQLNRAQKVLFVKIVKILLIAAAIIIGLKLVGIDLTALALFGGAIGLGIGFGLQKVFSNLISGIILLMDRSIQPGDVIAVGDTYGEVVNLEARYVSVVTRDGKKHLIPNENLIAEKVENWSYMDNKLRLRIPVGVSYDSDLYKVRDLLLEAAQEHPRILVDPEPKVLLRGFADYSVNFELRAWIEDPANGIGMPKSEILFLIWEKFKEHKIEIPFPQREIHIKTETVVEKKD